MHQVVAFADHYAVDNQGDHVLRVLFLVLELDAISLGFEQVGEIHNPGWVTVGRASVDVDAVDDGDIALSALGITDLLVAVRAEIDRAGHFNKG